MQLGRRQCPEPNLIAAGESKQMAINFEDKLKELIEGLKNDKQTQVRLDLNKFYQERIETIRTRLWNSLTWLAAAQGAALVLVIEQGKLSTEPGPELAVGQPILVFALAVLGILLSEYMRRMVKDGIGHIQSNQCLSNIAVGLEAKSSTQPVFDVMRTLATVALLAHIVLAI